MKKLYTLSILTSALLLLGITTQAQTDDGAEFTYEFAEDNNSLLWEISGKGLASPSYLYGTIHIQDKRVFQFSPVVRELFDVCDAYAMELLLDDVNMSAAMELMLMPGDTTLTMLLSEEDYAFVKAKIKEETGAGMFMFERMRPLFISTQLSVGEGNSEMEVPLDMHFDNLAKEQEKKRLGIEEFGMQAEAVDAITLKKQADMLVEGLRDTTSGNSEIEEFIEMYRSMEVEKMANSFEEDENMPENFEEAFLTKRNKVMAIKIAEYSTEQRTFNAVGAAHLGGDTGVIALLKEAGYTVKPILMSFNRELDDEETTD